jgi:ComF family protein
MSFINDFLSLIYPRYCEACANNLFRHEKYICNYCKLNLPKSKYHQNQENELFQVFAGRIPIVQAASLYLYEKSGKIQKLLQAIKYQDQKELAEFLGELYGRELKTDKVFEQIDCILAIPLHANKLKLRGYNQSEYFAIGLSKNIEKPINKTSLIRVVDTATQTKKHKYQRWENVEGIFKLENKEELANKHILLVDDVVTTGATIEAAWLALKDVEGIKISVASIAFAPKA